MVGLASEPQEQPKSEGKRQRSDCFVRVGSRLAETRFKAVKETRGVV